MNESHTLIGWIESLAKHKDQPAVLAFEKHDLRQWSFQVLARHVQRVANLLAERGVEKGDIVSLLAMPSPESVAACLAVIRAGAVVSPLDVQFADDVLQHVLQDSQPRLILTTSKYAKRLDDLDWEAPPENILLEDLFSEGSSKNDGRARSGEAASRIKRDAIQPKDTAVLFYTSGTTGPPKGVPLTHENVAFELQAVMDADVVADGDRALLPLPLHHVYPFVVGTLTPLAMGLPIIFPHSLTGPQLVRAIKEGGATVVIGVPRLYRALLSGVEANAASKGRIAAGLFHSLLKLSEWLRRGANRRWGKRLMRPLHKQFGPQLRMLASGGSPLDPELAWKLEAIGWQVAIGYGLTETSPLITLNRPGTGKLDSVGQVIPGVEIRLDPSAQPGDERPEKDEAGRRQGEILVRGPNVFSGYRNLPEKTDEAFTDGWFRTGDLGAIDEDGYVYVHGRASTMIVTEGGENVQPDEVEEAYSKHRAIREIGVLDHDGHLVGLVVPEIKELRQQGGDGAIEKQVRQAIKERGKDLPSYQRLADVAVTRESLPRTRLGKIQRHILEDRFERAKSEDKGSAEEAHPISEREMSGEDRTLLDDPKAKEVWDLLAEKYSDQRLTPDTSPQLDLGVDSMAWLDLSLEIRRRTGVELDAEAIGRIETVRDLLQEVAERSEDEAEAPAEDWLENPEAHLSEQQRKQLRPRGRAAVVLSRLIFSTSRLLMRGLFRVETRGEEHLPEGCYILAPNHVSYLDPPAVAASLDNRSIQQTYWGGWTGLMFSNPLFRAFSRVAQVLPIDPGQSAMSSILLGAVALERGKALVWFPEGERSPDGTLQPFRPGLGLLLERYDVPVVPVLIEGTYEALPMNRRLPRFRKVTVSYGAPCRRDELEQRGEGEERRDRIVNGLHDVMAEMTQPESQVGVG